MRNSAANTAPRAPGMTPPNGSLNNIRSEYQSYDRHDSHVTGFREFVGVADRARKSEKNEQAQQRRFPLEYASPPARAWRSCRIPSGLAGVLRMRW